MSGLISIFIKAMLIDNVVFVQYLAICPFIGIFILAFIFTGFEAFTMIVGFSWLAVGIIVGAVKSKGYKEVPDAFKNLEF